MARPVRLRIRIKHGFLAMKKKECPSCAMEVDTKAEICPICGYEFPVIHKGYIIVAILLLLITVLYFIL